MTDEVLIEKTVMRMESATEINLKLAEQYEQIAVYHRKLARLEKTAADEVAAKPSQPETSDEHSFTVLYHLSDRMKGKFAIVIWALYKMGMFVKTDGQQAKSVRDVANYIGQLFGLHFTKDEWKSTLEGSFKVLEPRRFFWEMADKVSEKMK